MNGNTQMFGAQLSNQRSCSRCVQYFRYTRAKKALTAAILTEYFISIRHKEAKRLAVAAPPSSVGVEDAFGGESEHGVSERSVLQQLVVDVRRDAHVQISIDGLDRHLQTDENSENMIQNQKKKKD